MKFCELIEIRRNDFASTLSFPIKLFKFHANINANADDLNFINSYFEKYLIKNSFIIHSVF